MELKQFATTLVNMIWEREQRAHRAVDTTVLGCVRDGVAAELAYRRSMGEFDRRIADLGEPAGAVGDD